MAETAAQVLERLQGAKRTANSHAGDDEEAQKARLRRARDWVRCYHGIEKIIPELLEQGVSIKDIADDNTFAGLIADHWAENSDERTKENLSELEKRYGTPTAK